MTADPAAAPPAADPPAADPPAADPPTLAALDQKVDRLADAIEKITGTAHQGSTEAVQGRLDAPGAIAQQVREELARADRERQAGELQATVESTAATVKALAEKPPVAPMRKITRAMFGKDPDR